MRALKELLHPAPAVVLIIKKAAHAYKKSAKHFESPENLNKSYAKLYHHNCHAIH